MRRATLIVLVAIAFAGSARAHDIPNARVDRSIQVTVRPRRMAVTYEVSLSELTLTQDLRSLIGSLPGAEPREWFDRYGREIGPLNAKGLLVTVDGRPIDMVYRGFDLTVEEHPRYVFQFDSTIPGQGRLSVLDSNYASSEGTSRLAVQGKEDVVIRGDDLPTEVALIPIRPVWQLSDLEERRTKQFTVNYSSGVLPAESKAGAPRKIPERRVSEPPNDRLSRLLRRTSGASLFGLILFALGLGAAHAVQPGHGKTLIAATVVGEGGTRLRGVLLALATTMTHTGSVLLVAAGLWMSRSNRYLEINSALGHGAGFVIAAIGLWRVGRHIARYGEHEREEHRPGVLGTRGIISLGIAGGLVPCWDAVAMIVIAEALGQLALGVLLLVAFGLGMALVLIAVGSLAGRLRRLVFAGNEGATWERRLGIASGLALSAIGMYLLVGP